MPPHSQGVDEHIRSECFAESKNKPRHQSLYEKP